MTQFAVTVEGIGPLLAKLDELPRKIGGTILRHGVEAACRPLVKAAKARVPVDSGALRKSLGMRVKTYRSTGTVVGVIGPRRGFAKGKKFTRLKAKERIIKLDNGETQPTKYAHMTEFGTRHQPAEPWMRPALDTTAQQAISDMRASVLAAIEREAAKSTL